MKVHTGTPAAGGLCMGPVFRVERYAAAARTPVEDPVRETALFEAAAALAKEEIGALQQRVGGEEGDIFLFQKAILDDNGLLQSIRTGITGGFCAAEAVEQAAQMYAARLRSIPDEYLSQRASDVLDACRRVVAILDGRPRESIRLEQPAVLIADELFPGDLAGLDKTMIMGVVMSEGSMQSHAAILARTYGFPTLVQAGEGVLAIPTGSLCCMDAADGTLIEDPDEATRARFAHRIQLSRRKSMAEDQLRRAPCVTADGVALDLMANCSAPEDIAVSVKAGADGVGLLRSEFLVLDGSWPDEEAQYAFYKACLEAAEGRPVTIRTLDIGADKKLPGVSWEDEENPALGMRGLRLSLAKPEILHTQLCALFRAGMHGKLKIMFPMITTPRDLERALAAAEKAKADLAARGIPFEEKVPCGCMIETPSAALCADVLAQKAAFFSIGTNDLTQYTMAADRLAPALAEYFDPIAPAVQALIRMTVQAAQAAGIAVSVCGEAAADPECALVYAKLGVRCLSMAAVSILDVKLALGDAVICE